MQKKQTINLTIKPNSHRLIVSLGEKVTLFCSAQYKFFQGRIHIAGIIIEQAGAKFTTEQDEFVIENSDAAKLMNLLARKAFQGSISLAAPVISNKWDRRISFAAKDFEN